MKKLIILALTAVIMVGCTDKQKARIWENEGFVTLTFDSCEYVYGTNAQQGFLAHKGNCRFCAERRKQELQSIVEQLKKSNYGLQGWT